MGTDLRAIMRRDQRRRAMIQDPDLSGDTLLFSLVLDEVLSMRRSPGPQRFVAQTDWVGQVADLARGDLASADMRRFWAKRVLAEDAPRYEPTRGADFPTCVAPMIRREGLCGQRGTTHLIDHDPETGEGQRIGLCSRHRELEKYYERRRLEWVANGAPVPPPNRGGVLMRYFRTDWDEVYTWAGGRKPHPGKRLDPTPPRPHLRLVD